MLFRPAAGVWNTGSPSAPLRGRLSTAFGWRLTSLGMTAEEAVHSSQRRNNAKAQTWKMQSGSVGDRTGLHGIELWSGASGQQAGWRWVDPGGIRAWRDLF